MNKHISDDRKLIVLEAVRLNGMSVTEAAKKYDVGVATIYRWLKNEKYESTERSRVDALTDDQKEWLRRMPKSFKKLGAFDPAIKDDVSEYNQEMMAEIIDAWPTDENGYFLEPGTDVEIMLAGDIPQGKDEPVVLPSDVANPEYYTSGDIECIDAIRASMTDDGFIQYLRGNVMKYIWRDDKKGFAKKDLEKAVWYITKIISMIDE